MNDGDILVIELWAENSQQNAQARTNTIFYDGTTEGSTTSDAAFLQAPGALTFYRSLRQSGYRLFNNADSVNVGTPLAAQDTPAALGATGANFRLRMLLHVADINLGIGGQAFKLQFVGKGSGTCAAPTGGTPAAWTDVTAATVIAFNNNATPADGAALTANANDPTHGGDTIVNQTYEELNNFTNTVAVNRGQDGKWDFALRDNAAPGSTTYCLRAVKSTGTALDTYYVFPEITTAVGSSTAGGFNAYETSTAGGAITGSIRTKVAGSAASVDMIALNVPRTAIETTFIGTVRVEVLDASNNAGALDANGCRPTWSVIQTLSPDPAFAGGDNGRKTISFTQLNSYPNARLRITYPAGAPTVTGCSSDNFAIRPVSLSVAVTDSTWDSAGTTRTLNNTGATGGVVHKAGRSFTVRATPAPATATNYNGDPTVRTLTCTLPATCANGTLVPGAFSAIGSGVRESTTATYSEVGAFDLTLEDQNYAAVDLSDGTPDDCTAAGRRVCSSALAVGRFVPDRFAIVQVTAPEFRTFDALNAACSGPRSFTYTGQLFGYVTAPSGTVQAQNASGGVTSNYRGALWKLTAAAASQSFANSPVMALDNSGVLTPTLTEIANTGTGTLTADSADKLAFTRNTAAPAAPFNANLSLTWSVSDAAEAGANQGTITTATPLVFNGSGSGIAFDSGAGFRYGRLRIGNANGSHLVPLPTIVEAQYWGYTNPPANTVLGFITNAADNCTAIANNNIAMAFSGNLAACETAASGGAVLTAGRRVLLLAAPGSGNDGAALLTANLGTTASGTACIAVGGGTVPAAGAGRLYLQGNWSGSAYDDNPNARATFGTVKGAGEVIFIRENF